MLGDTNEVEMTRIMIDAAAGPAHRVSGMFDNLIVKVGEQGFHLWGQYWHRTEHLIGPGGSQTRSNVSRAGLA